MSTKELKLVNITALFEHLDLSLISNEDIKKRLEFSQEKDKGTSFIEAPGLKAIILPSRKTGIIFEQNKLRIDDTSGNKPEETKIVDYFFNINDLLGQYNFLAYGLNFGVSVKSEKEFKFEEYLSEKIKKSIDGTIEGAGAVVSFSKGDKKFLLNMKPSANPKELIFNLNVHNVTENLPEKDSLAKEISEYYPIFNDQIDKIIAEDKS